MDVGNYIRVIRRRWRIIAATLLVVVGIAAAVTALTEPLYRARAQLYVSTVGTDNATDLAQGSSFTQRQVTTYADIATTPYVLEPVIEELDLDRTPSELAGQIAAQAPVGTVILEISVTDPDSDMALDIAEAVSNHMVETLGELDQVNQSSASPVKATIVTPATLANAPVSPQVSRNLLLASVLGLVLGVGLAILRDLLDSSIRSEEDARGVSDAPILGGITFDKEAAKLPNLIIDKPHHTHSEAFRTLRTNLQFVNLGEPPRSIVLTSSLPAEGKTTTTAHLAQTLAAAGKRVCIVEGDLRRPRLMKYLGMEGGVGLTNVLIGEAELDDMLQPYGDTSLTVLGSGPIPPNPAELLGSERMQALIKELSNRFDMVIVDAPPLLPVTDAAVLSRVTEGAVLVVGAGIVKREHLARTMQRLEQAQGHLLGLILNQLPTRGADAYYGGYYGGYYAPETSTRHSSPRRVTKSNRKKNTKTTERV